jgi:hypothetical protein
VSSDPGDDLQTSARAHAKASEERWARERADAKARGVPYAERLDIAPPPHSEPEVLVVMRDGGAFVNYLSSDLDEVVIRFGGVLEFTANLWDAGIETHPLWGSGLELFRLHVVHRSPRLALIEQCDRMRRFGEPFELEGENPNHYVMTFPEGTLECVAHDARCDSLRPEESGWYKVNGFVFRL